MLSERMLKQLNEQITKEFFSGYLYMSMAAYFEDETLPGFANWMRVQAQEETAHAVIIFNYVCEQGGRVELGGFEKPECDFSSPLDVYEKTYAHEQKVTASINNLMSIADEERDYATRSMLNWFVDEQVEEEANDTTIIAQLKRIGSDTNALYMLDKEMGARVFNIPSPLAAKA